MPRLSNASLARLRAEVVNSKQIPTIPVVLVRILEVVDGERTCVRDLVEVVEKDKALTGRILRLSNSAFFGFARKVSTLSRAVMLLGFSTVKNLALGVKVWEALTGGRTGADMEGLWIHSSLVAVASRLLSRRLKLPDPEEAFTAGLLHDIGKVVLAIRFPEQYQALLATAGGQAGSEAEREALGIDHAQVGGWLAESWTLPPVIVAAASEHPRLLGSITAWDAGTVVNLANQLVNATDLGQADANPELIQLLRELQDPIITVEVWSEITKQLEAQEAELKGFFSPPDGETGGSGG